MPCSIFRTGTRIAVIGALAGGAAILIAGPDRVLALVSQARHHVNDAIDKNIDDPTALRSQLHDLEGQYPQRISEVRGDLAELNAQIAQLNRDYAVSKRVVELADADLAQMKGILGKAEQTRASASASATGAPVVVKVRFDDRQMGLDEAYAKASKVSQLRGAYATKVADIERDMGYLGQQQSRLSKLLEQLETERAEFQAQIWQLDRQVDTIARNDRMIDLMKKRQETIDEQSRYRVASLDQLTARFADIRARQESQLESLSQNADGADYENQAKIQLDSQSIKNRPFGPSAGTLFPSPRPVEVGPSVIEIGPGDVAPSPQDDDSAHLVSRQ